MLLELHKQLRLDFVSCSIHVSTSREVDKLIKTASLACETARARFHYSLNRFNKWFKLNWFKNSLVSTSTKPVLYLT